MKTNVSKTSILGVSLRYEILDRPLKTYEPCIWSPERCGYFSLGLYEDKRVAEIAIVLADKMEPIYRMLFGAVRRFIELDAASCES